MLLEKQELIQFLQIYEMNPCVTKCYGTMILFQ